VREEREDDMKRTLWSECVALALLGGLGLYGGLSSYLRSDARTQSSSLQPGVYVAGISVALLVVALAYGIASYRRSRGTVPVPEDRSSGAAEQDGNSRTVWIVYMGIVLYALLIMAFGYVVATLAFLLAEFRVLGERSWVRNIAMTVLITALFWVVFVHYGEMVFPRGMFSE